MANVRPGAAHSTQIPRAMLSYPRTPSAESSRDELDAWSPQMSRSTPLGDQNPLVLPQFDRREGEVDHLLVVVAHHDQHEVVPHPFEHRHRGLTEGGIGGPVRRKGVQAVEARSMWPAVSGSLRWTTSRSHGSAMTTRTAARTEASLA